MVHTTVYSGQWFLTDNPENKTFGTLLFTDNGKPNLIVYEKLENSVTREFDTHNQIIGHVYDFTKKNDFTIELVNVLLIAQNHDNSVKYTYQCDEWLICKGYKNHTSFQFNGIMLHTDILNDWVEPLKNIRLLNNSETRLNFEIHYSQPQGIELYTDEMKVIYFYFRGGYSWTLNRKCDAHESRWINVEFNKSINLEEIHTITSSLENLFTLLFNSSVKFNSVELKGSNCTVYTHNLSGRKENFDTNTSSRSAIHFEFFKNKSQVILHEWFTKEKELRLLVNSFFSTFGNKTMFDENRFMTYMSLLEQYHKLRFNDYIPKGTKYLKMFNKVLGELKGDSLSWVKARLDDKTEITLRTRLSDLFERFTIPIDNEKLEKLIETRNYFVHLDESNKNILTKDGVNETNRILEDYIIKILLHEIAITHK